MHHAELPTMAIYSHGGQFSMMHGMACLYIYIYCGLDWLYAVQVRRRMEEENRRAQKAARKEYMDNVRELAAFVRKRDKRVSAFQVLCQLVLLPLHLVIDQAATVAAAAAAASLVLLCSGASLQGLA